MMARVTIWICFLIAIALPNGKASPESFYSENIPLGVAFGITPEQLVQARPQVQKDSLNKSQVTQAEESGSMVEYIRQGNGATVYWYRFKNGKLGAVSRSTATRNLSSESAQSGASQVYNKLRENFDLRGQDEILRLGGAGTSLLSAQLWEDKEKGRNIYFIASSQEISVIVFDHKSFGAADFFASLDKRKEIDAQAKSVRDMLGESLPTPSPIVDLLPMIAKESASTPQPATKATMQSIAVPSEKQQSSVRETPTESQSTAETKSSPWPWIIGAIILLAVASGVLLKLRRK
jgi:hypothetical protein